MRVKRFRFSVHVMVVFMTVLGAIFLHLPSSHAAENNENLALGKNVTVTSFCNSCGTPGSNAVDGDVKTFWRALSGDARPTITVDLGEETEWNKVVLNVNEEIINEYSVEYSSDGENWEEAYVHGFPPANTIENFVIEPVNSRYVRIGFAPNATGVALLYELEIYHVDEEPTPAPASVLTEVSLKDSGTTYGFWDEIELEIGDKHQLSVSGKMSDGGEADLSEATVSYQSSDTQIVEVDEHGKMTVVGHGVAKVGATVELGSRSRSTEIFVVVKNYKDDVIIDASWSGEDIISKIGQPAVLEKGKSFPALQMRAYTDVKIEGQLLDSTGKSEQPVSLELDKNENGELLISGTADTEGTYKLELTLTPTNQAPVYDTFYFTVRNSEDITEGQSKIAYLGEDGKMQYVPDYKGNRILDFSHSGYKGGGVKLPDVQARVVVEPEEGDDTARIQDAIDRVSQMPIMEDGFRGAVVLERGTFEVGETLTISADGVVLRGKGSGEDGTILYATGKKSRDVLQVIGSGAPTIVENSGTEITELYVPAGARTFKVEDASGFKVGDTVMVRRHGNDQWIHEIDMDQIIGGESIVQWSPFSLDFDRVITEIDGNSISVDAPIANAIERQWGGGEIFQYTDEGRIENVGVENLRVKVEFDPSVIKQHNGEDYYADENKARNFVSLNNVKDAWVRNIDAFHLEYALADIGRNAKGITVQDSRALEPVGEIAGSRRYAYNYSGQLALTQRVHAEHFRHAFVVNSRVPGPNVFLDSTSENEYTNSEPHHRWSVGGLYDNIKGNIAFQDRASYGTGHGWSGANYVAWNTEGNLIAQSPPTAQNYAIGHVGESRQGNWPNDNDPRPREDAYWDSHGKHVAPQSLYLQQLKDRLGEVAIKNIAETPVGGEALDTPEADHLSTIQMIHVNGVPLEGFDPEKFAYQVEIPLDMLDAPYVTAEGGHNVHIIQAEKLSDRTVIQVENKDNPGIITEYVLTYTQTLQPDQLQYVDIAEVVASADDGNVPENMLDGDLSTRWSAEGEQWVQFDLGEVHSISSVLLAFHNGDKRRSLIDIELSVDGEQWERKFSGQSNGNTLELEMFNFDKTPARYVRILGHGNSANAWNSITEAKIAKYVAEATEVKVNGHVQVQVESSKPGSNVHRIHTQINWQRDQEGVVSGSSRLHTRPRGIDVSFEELEWLATSETVTLQWQGKDKQGKTYTVRTVLTKNDSQNPSNKWVASFVVWEGETASGEPQIVAMNQPFKGNIDIK